MGMRTGLMVLCGSMAAAGLAGAGVADSGPATGTDPNYSRLLFAPTARPLGQGEGYVSDHEVLFPGVAFGVTDNVSLAGGMSVIPALGLSEQVFYLSPKVGFELSDRASVAVGALVATGGGGHFDDREYARIGFAVGTFGSPRHSFTVGAGLGDTSSEFSDAVPILMAGGVTTLSPHVALVGETWMFLDEDFDLGSQPFGVGVRLFNERLSADLGLILVGDLLDQGFPIPWVSVAYHFGKRR